MNTGLDVPRGRQLVHVVGEMIDQIHSQPHRNSGEQPTEEAPKQHAFDLLTACASPLAGKQIITFCVFLGHVPKET